MGKINPKVSIVIPVYNGSNYMREAIDSALAQTYDNLEIIVVNDGSNDTGKTDSIALSYGNKIRYLKKENGGVSTALNYAIKEMSGEYFSWLSHDDVYYPNKILDQISYLSKINDKKVILYSDYDLIDSKSRLFQKSIKDHEELTLKPEYALLRGSINGITLLIPKQAFTDCGLFDESLLCTQDYYMWLKMSKRYKFVHMPVILAKSRQHRNQVTLKDSKVITEGNRLWIDMIETPSLEDKQRLEGSEFNYYDEMANYLEDSVYKEALSFCLKKCEEIKKNDISGNLSINTPSKNVSFKNKKGLSKIIRLKNNIKDYGLAMTLKKIIIKIFK